MKTSDEALEIMKQYEGKVIRNEVHVVYDDADGIPLQEKNNDLVGFATIGYGHLLKDHESFSSINEEKATELFRKDLHIAEDDVSRLVNVELTQGQYDSCVDMFFNIGSDKLKDSTFLKLLNEGDYNGAGREIPKWRRSNKKILKGLQKRCGSRAKMWFDNEYVHYDKLSDIPKDDKYFYPN